MIKHLARDPHDQDAVNAIAELLEDIKAGSKHAFILLDTDNVLGYGLTDLEIIGMLESIKLTLVLQNISR